MASAQSYPLFGRETWRKATDALQASIKWWCGEIRSLVPARLEKALLGDTRELFIRFDGTRYQFGIAERGQVAAYQPFELDATNNSDPPEGDTSELDDLLVSEASRQTLVLGGGVILQCRTTLPAAVGSSLVEVLDVEIDRLTPFSSHDLYYAHAVQDSPQDPRSIEVELHYSPRETIDRVLAQLSGLGLNPRRVVPELGQGRAHDADLNILRSTKGPAGDNVRKRLLTLALVSTVVALVGLNLFLWFQNKGSSIEDIEQRIAVLQEAAADAESVRESIIAKEHDLGFLARERDEVPYALELLERATRLLPDDTHLLQYRWKAPSLTLTGLSGDASRLTTVFESDAHFDSARFTTAITKDARSGLDRFDLQVLLAVGGSGDAD